MALGGLTVGGDSRRCLGAHSGGLQAVGEKAINPVDVSHGTLSWTSFFTNWCRMLKAEVKSINRIRDSSCILQAFH